MWLADDSDGVEGSFRRLLKCRDHNALRVCFFSREKSTFSQDAFVMVISSDVLQTVYIHLKRNKHILQSPKISSLIISDKSISDDLLGSESLKWRTGGGQASYVNICVCVSMSEPLVLVTWSQRALQGWLGGRLLGPSSPTHSPSPSLQTWRATACGEPRPSGWCLMLFVPTPGDTALSWRLAPTTPRCPPARKTTGSFTDNHGEKKQSF